MVDNISKPFTFYSNTYAKANEVNADFDSVYTGVNACVNQINANITSIGNLNSNKANKNGDATQVFNVANAVGDTNAINKQTLMGVINNTLDYISGYTITKTDDAEITVSAGSCYDSTEKILLKKNTQTVVQNDNQGANTTYYVYVIGDATGSQVTVVIDSSSVSPGFPEGYSKHRKIGYYTTDGDGNIYFVYSNEITSLYNSGIKAVIVESYSNGSNWYNLYSNKFYEEGGYVASPGAGLEEINLHKTMADTNYSVSAIIQSTYDNVTFYTPWVYQRGKTTTKVTLGINQNPSGVYWRVSGYIA